MFEGLGTGQLRSRGGNMQFAVVGVEHQRCPVEIREPMALEGHAEGLALEFLGGVPAVDECVVVSTCARTELYLWGADPAQAVAEANDYLLRLNPLAAPYIQTRRGEAAVGHLFRVASGLESQIVGEDEVAGQVRRSVQLSRDHELLGPNLGPLFQAAIACSRRVRRETAPAHANVAAAALALCERFKPLEQSNVLVIGSGKIARLLAGELSGAHGVTFASRHPASLLELIGETGAKVVALDEALAGIDTFDVILTATRS